MSNRYSRMVASGQYPPEGYTVVDPYLLVFFQWGQRIGIRMRDNYRHWSAATYRTLARPAVQRTLQKEGINIE